MNCSETLKTHALFDGELRGADAVDVERHAATCPECKDLLRDLASTRQALRNELSYFGASEPVLARVLDAIVEEQDKVVRFPARVRSFWRGAASGAIGMAAAASIAFALLVPSDNDMLVAEVTNAHIRSLIGTHLVDVASSDAGQTEQWLRAHTGVATPIAAASTGFRLVGGRADYVYGASSAVSVYRRGTHTVNVFAWTEREDESLPKAAANKGYNIVIWKKGAVVFCAISNIPRADLERLASTLRNRSA